MPDAPVPSSEQPTIYLRLEVYRGVPEIAKFLNMHERTVWRMIQNGELPVKRDTGGTWVLTNIDYLLSLQG